MNDITSIGIIGLGNMGLPIATRLAAAGYTVTGFDVAEAARARLVEHGGRAADTPADAAAGADALILMLPDSTIVSQVMSDAALRATLSRNQLVVDMGSSEPVRTRSLAAELDADGVALVDAPVSGGVSGATAGTLTIMVGGAARNVERLTPALSALGRVRHAGPVGSGHAIKALNNLISATHLWVTSEAILTGEKFGLRPEVMLEIINGSSGRSGSSENKWPNFILPGTFDSGFALRLMLKDMKTATALAEQLGMPIELGEAAVAEWTRAAEAMAPAADHTEVARYLAQESAVRM
ncbi:NAD(P)-dependent oxidoreductase [Microbacterium sp. RD1]|uniref:NAD(P)-dependent oxidoreductase n=1 Tax=Microbacterium sp. RD1 TaxID=3457313 RepID=UPI003FA5578C